MKQNKKNIVSVSVGILSVAAASIVGVGIANATIVNSLDFGSTGSQVTELQQFLATNPAIYPSGRVTGYFGLLTQGGVQNFQAAQGIVSSGTPSTTGFGRVGPTTMARINSLSGGTTQNSGEQAPTLSTPVVQVVGTTATISWNTDQTAIGQIFYATAPIQSDEASGPHQQPYVSGTGMTLGGGYQQGHTVTLQNLASNTTYYFLVRATNTSGDMSMVLPSSFHTN